MDKEQRVQEGEILPHVPGSLEKLQLRAVSELSGCPSRMMLLAWHCVAD